MLYDENILEDVYSLIKNASSNLELAKERYNSEELNGNALVVKTSQIMDTMSEVIKKAIGEITDNIANMDFSTTLKLNSNLDNTNFSNTHSFNNSSFSIEQIDEEIKKKLYDIIDDMGVLTDQQKELAKQDSEALSYAYLVYMCHQQEAFNNKVLPCLNIPPFILNGGSDNDTSEEGIQQSVTQFIMAQIEYTPEVAELLNGDYSIENIEAVRKQLETENASFKSQIYQYECLIKEHAYDYVDSLIQTDINYNATDSIQDILSLWFPDGMDSEPSVYYSDWNIYWLSMISFDDDSIINLLNFIYHNEGFKKYYLDNYGKELTKEDLVVFFGISTDFNSKNSLLVRSFLMMNDNQLNKYNYLYTTEGKNAANDYLNAIEDGINRQLGFKYAKEAFASIDPEKELLALAQTFGIGVGDGLVGCINNIMTTFNGNTTMTPTEYKAYYLSCLLACSLEIGEYSLEEFKTAYNTGELDISEEAYNELITKDKISVLDIQLANNQISQEEYLSYQELFSLPEYQEFFAKTNGNGSTPLIYAYQVGNGVGNMLPSMVTSALFAGAGAANLGKSAANLLLFLQSYGGNYKENIRSGNGQGISMIAASLTAGGEVASEYLLGRLAGIGKDKDIVGLATDLTQYTYNYQIIGNHVLEVLKDVGGEIREELLQDLGSSIINAIVLGEPLDISSMPENAKETAIITAFTTLILNAPTNAINLSGDMYNLNRKLDLNVGDGRIVTISQNELNTIMQELIEMGIVKSNSNGETTVLNQEKYDAYVLNKISTYSNGQVTLEINNSSTTDVSSYKKLTELLKNIDSKLGNGKGLEIVKKYSQTGNIAELSELGFREYVLDIPVDQIKSDIDLLENMEKAPSGDVIFEQTNSFTEMGNHTINTNPISKTKKSFISSLKEKISLKSQKSLSNKQGEMIKKINHMIDGGQNCRATFNSTTELSTTFLSQIKDLSKLEVSLQGVFCDENGKFREKYNKSSGYLDRITYNGIEMLQIMTEIENLASMIDPNLSKKEKAQQIFDTLVNYIPTNYENSAADFNVSNSLRGIISNNAVGKKGLICAGFANLYYELCNKFGIECEYVRGLGYDSEGRNPGKHAWNVVRINEEIIPVDVCWGACNKGNNPSKWFGGGYEFALRHVADTDQKFKIYDQDSQYGNIVYNNDMINPKETNVFVKLDGIIRTQDQRYNNGIQALEKYLATHEEKYITSQNGARSAIIGISDFDIIAYLSKIKGNGSENIDNAIISDNQIPSSQLQQENNTGISQYVTEQLDAIVSAQDQKYGLGDGIKALREYLKTGNSRLITSLYGARDKIGSISKYDIENYLSNIQEKNNVIVGDNQIPSSQLQQENNTGISQYVTEQLDTIVSAQDQKYGLGDGIKALREYLKTGNSRLITSLFGARDKIGSISKHDIEIYLSNIENNNNVAESSNQNSPNNSSEVEVQNVASMPSTSTESATSNFIEASEIATEDVVDSASINNSEVESNNLNIEEIQEKVEIIEPAKEQVENNTITNPTRNIKSMPELMKSLGTYLERGHLEMNMLLKQSVSGEDSFHTANSGVGGRNFNNYVKDRTTYHETLSNIINIFSIMVERGETNVSKKGIGGKLFRSTTMEEVLGGGLMGFISTATEPLSVISTGVKDEAKASLILSVADNVFGIVPKDLGMQVKGGENEVLLAPFCNIEYGSTNPDGTINATVTPGVLEKTNVGFEQVEAEQEHFAKSLDDYNQLSEELYNTLYSLKDSIASGNMPNIINDTNYIFTLQKEINKVENSILGYKENVKKYLMNQFIAIQEEAGKIIIPYIDNTSKSTTSNNINNNQSSSLALDGLFKKYLYESSQDSSVSYKSLQSIFETFNEKMQDVRNLYDKIKNDEVLSDKTIEFKDQSNGNMTIESDNVSLNISNDEISLLNKLFGNDFWSTIEGAQSKDAIAFFKTFKEGFSQFKENLIKETIAKKAHTAYIDADGIKLNENGRWYTIPKYMLDQVEGKTANEVLYDILLHQDGNFSGAVAKFDNLYGIKLEKTSSQNYTLRIKGKTYSLGQNVMDTLRLETVSGSDAEVLKLAQNNPDKVLRIIENPGSQMTSDEAVMLGNILGENWREKIDELPQEKIDELKGIIASGLEKIKNIQPSSDIDTQFETSDIDISRDVTPIKESTNDNATYSFESSENNDNQNLHEENNISETDIIDDVAETESITNEEMLNDNALETANLENIDNGMSSNNTANDSYSDYLTQNSSNTDATKEDSFTDYYKKSYSEEKIIPSNLKTHIMELLSDEGVSKSRIDLWLDSLTNEQIESLASQYDNFSEILDAETGDFGSSKYFDYISAATQQKRFDNQIKNSIFEFNSSSEEDSSTNPETARKTSDDSNDSYTGFL